MTERSRALQISILVPLVIGLSAALRALPRVRTVDWLLIFAGGMCAGVCLVMTLRLLRPR
jgi:hypothetical protein